MEEPPHYDEPALDDPVPPGRARRAINAAILVLLIVSMVFLAYVSGRGVIGPAEAPTHTPGPSVDQASTDAAHRVSAAP